MSQVHLVNKLVEITNTEGNKTFPMLACLVHSTYVTVTDAEVLNVGGTKMWHGESCCDIN